MARRVDIPKGKVFVGHDVVIGIAVVDEVTKEWIDMGGWTLEFVVRETPSGAVLLTKTAPHISVDSHESGVNNMALISLYDSDTWNGTTIIFSGKKYYGLRRSDVGAEVLLAYGDIPFEVVAAR